MNRSLRYFEGLDELRRYLEPTFKDMTESKSHNFKRVLRHTYKDSWYEDGTGYIEITIEAGSGIKPEVKEDVQPVIQKESWFKRIFK